MNTNQLEYLIEISKNSSMSAASEKLHMSPQALSTSIKKLEDELGFSLLYRSHKGIALTSDGKWLVHEATIFLDKINERQKLHYNQQPNTPHIGKLNIFINYSGINNNILGQLICSLLDKEPELVINLQETSKSHIIEKVLSNDEEFGFIFQTTYNDVFTENIPDGLIFEPYLDGNLVFSVSEQSECAKFNSISLKKPFNTRFAPIPHIQNHKFFSTISFQKHFTLTLNSPAKQIFQSTVKKFCTALPVH